MTRPLESFTSVEGLEEKNLLRVKITKVYEDLASSIRRVVIAIGGAGSSKSHSIAQLFIKRLLNCPGRKMLVCRKTGPALFLTAYALIWKLLIQYRIYSRLKHDKSHWIITNPSNEAMIVFISIDDPVKIKSTDWNDVWLEEADEFTWNDFLIVQTRMRESTGDVPNQIFFSLNPGQEQGWINTKVITAPKFKNKVDVFWSSYTDNLQNLSKEYIEILEDLKDQDIDTWNIYAKGIWGSLSNRIYKPYIVLEKFPEKFDEIIYGMDFGFNNPSALLEIGIKDKWNGYLTQKFYETKHTNGLLIEKVKEIIPLEHRHREIYADAAEPARIEEFNQEGFNVLPADKKVKDGIDFCKRFKFYTKSSNVDLNKEAPAYKWKKTKDGEILDEPVKFMDHLMDSKRYALWTHNKQFMNSPDIRVIE